MKFTVKQGKRYRAKIRLGFFEQAAGNSTIAQKFVDAGFTNVAIEGGGRDRWAVGTWPASDRAAELPDQIVQVVEI